MIDVFEKQMLELSKKCFSCGSRNMVVSDGPLCSCDSTVVEPETKPVDDNEDDEGTLTFLKLFAKNGRQKLNPKWSAS